MNIKNVLTKPFSRLFGVEAVKGLEVDLFVFYQPDPVLRERLPSPEVFTRYVERLQGICKTFFSTAVKPETLHIVVAIKPGKQSRVWFVSSIRLPDAEELEPLRVKLERVTPVDVHHGPVAFAIAARIAGGDGRIPGGVDYQPPLPQEWKDAADGKMLMIPDGILELVWPDASSIPVRNTALAPTELVTQVLEPTGGKILCPKGWFYSEKHQGGVTFRWTLSREDASEGSYTTGVRIQAFFGVEKLSGKSPRQFILDFVAAKKKGAARIIKTYAEQRQGPFTRIGLETQEGPHHILCSCFWGNDLDIAVVSISGTTKELWGTYSPIFEKMSAIELIDMARLEE